jgi:O-antigen/teichoic acid export membrane protein
MSLLVAYCLDSNIEWEKNIVKYSYPFAIWGSFTWLVLSSDRWALEYFSSSKEVAQYAVLYQLGYAPISIVSGFAMALISPVLFNKVGSGESQSKKRQAHQILYYIVGAALAITLIAFLGTLILHPFIFQLLVDSQYATVSYLLPWLVLSGGIFASGQAVSLKFATDMEVNNMIAPKIVTAIVGTALNFGLVYLWGLIGVVIANIIFSALYLIWTSYLVMNRDFFLKAINFR